MAHGHIPDIPFVFVSFEGIRWEDDDLGGQSPTVDTTNPVRR